MDRGAWWATVCGVTKSWTQLKRLSKRLYKYIVVRNDFRTQGCHLTKVWLLSFLYNLLGPFCLLSISIYLSIFNFSPILESFLLRLIHWSCFPFLLLLLSHPCIGNLLLSPSIISTMSLHLQTFHVIFSTESLSQGLLWYLEEYKVGILTWVKETTHCCLLTSSIFNYPDKWNTKLIWWLFFKVFTF